MNTLRNGSLVIAALVCCTRVASQENYLFEHVPADERAYVDLPSDVAINGFDMNGLFTLDELSGETFTLFDRTFTLGGTNSIRISAHGEVQVMNDNVTSSIHVAGGGATAIDQSSRISYAISGPWGERVLTVQYKHMRFNEGGPDNFFNAQIRIEQASGIIELRYGTRSQNNGSGFSIFTGPKAGLLLASPDESTCFEKAWLTGLPNSPLLDYSASCDRPGLLGLPLPGTVFRFVPTFSIIISVPEDQHNNDHLLYPNPAADHLVLRSTSGAPIGPIRVLDVGGEVALQAGASTDRYVLDVATLAPGTYFVHVVETGTFSRFQKL